MKNEKIIAYIEEQEQITVPMLQRRFSIPYGQAKAVVDDLAGKGKLVYDSGIVYNVRAERMKAQTRVKSPRTGSDAGAAAESPFSRFFKTENTDDDSGDYGEIDKTEGDDELKEEEKKVLWLFINGDRSHFVISQKLKISSLKVYMIIRGLQSKGYLTGNPVITPTLTAEQFIEKFGEVQIEEMQADDKNGGNGDKKEQTKEEVKSKPTFAVNYYELFRLKKIFNESLEKRVQSKRWGSETYSILELDGGRCFKLVMVNDVMKISDCGTAFSACKNTDKAMKILKEYKNLTYESGEIVGTVQDRTQAICVLLDLYASCERIKNAE